MNMMMKENSSGCLGSLSDYAESLKAAQKPQAAQESTVPTQSEMWGSYQGGQTWGGWYPSHDCPYCGRCPHCGRGGNYQTPYYQPPWPNYPQPYVGDLPGWWNNGPTCFANAPQTGYMKNLQAYNNQSN